MKSRKDLTRKEMQYKASVRNDSPNAEEQQTVTSGSITACIHSFFKSVKHVYETLSTIQPEPNTDPYPF